jgi:hypothetical protein
MKTSWLILAPLCFGSLAHAEGFNYEPLYIGGGLSSNRLDGFDNATGYQLFAGYNLDYMLGPVTTAVEAGYMDSGDFDLSLPTPGFAFSPPSDNATGGWVSANFGFAVNERFECLGRVGFDFGDDDGALLGVGVEYKPAKQFGIRGEYIARREINSLQVNVVYYPGWSK